MTLADIKARLAAALAATQRAIAGNVPDVLLLGGAASVSYGAWLMYAPAGFITGGVLLIVAGVLASRGNG